MRAAVIDRYGPPEVVRVAEVPRPTPGAGHVVVRVCAVAVTSGDARIRGARFPPGFGLFARLAFGVARPRRSILGMSFSGEVSEVGPEVHDLSPGDRVCAMTGMSMGAHAEYVAVKATRLARTPLGVRHEDAAGLLFGGTTAWYFLHDKADVGPGVSVLVNGASGAIGTNAVQLAHQLGATVTAVTSSANLELVRELGAHDVIDHTVQDVADTTERRLAGDVLAEVVAGNIPVARLHAQGSGLDIDYRVATAEGLAAEGERFDVVLDAVGNLSIASGRRLLTERGKLLLAVAGLGDMIRARGDVAAGTAPERVADIDQLLEMVADERLTVVLDEVLGLDEIVQAYRRVDSGHKVGNLVLRP